MAPTRPTGRWSTGALLVKARIGGPAARPSQMTAAPTFAEFLGRLSQGRLEETVAADILLIDAESASLMIDFDRETGLVRHWRISTRARASNRYGRAQRPPVRPRT